MLHTHFVLLTRSGSLRPSPSPRKLQNCFCSKFTLYIMSGSENARPVARLAHNSCVSEAVDRAISVLTNITLHHLAALSYLPSPLLTGGCVGVIYVGQLRRSKVDFSGPFAVYLPIFQRPLAGLVTREVQMPYSCPCPRTLNAKHTETDTISCITLASN